MNMRTRLHCPRNEETVVRSTADLLTKECLVLTCRKCIVSRVLSHAVEVITEAMMLD